MKTIYNLFFLVIFSVFIVSSCATTDIDLNDLPKFVKSDFIELSKIERISKFRSGAGHDYSDGFESCRSMKHYFHPDTVKWHTVNVLSPVNGIISKLDEENNIKNGTTQIQIKSDEYPAFIFVIFHVNLLNKLSVGQKIKENQQLGTTASTDIAVIYKKLFNYKYISYFELMNDSLFENYKNKGITSREEVIISKEVRDKNPFNCNGEEFLNSNYNWFDDWIFLK